MLVLLINKLIEILVKGVSVLGKNFGFEIFMFFIIVVFDMFKLL